MSLVIAGTVFVAAALAIGAAARDRRVQAGMRVGQDLARQMLAEIMMTRYADPNGSSPPPAGTARTNWDGVDDYNGLVESPPVTKTGVAIGYAAGWQRSVTVQYVSLNLVSLVQAILGSDTGLKKITVTVTSPQGVQTTLIGYRCKWGVPDNATPATGLATWTGASVTVGPDQRGVSVGTNLVNMPAP